MKKAWLIVIALETGANVNYVCDKINICKAGSASTVETNHMPNHAMSVCTEMHQRQSDGFKAVCYQICLLIHFAFISLFAFV